MSAVAEVGTQTLLDDRWAGCVFAGGWAPPTTGAQIDVIEPATGTSLGAVGLAGPDDVARAAAAAADAQPAWAAMPPRERAEIFRRAAAAFERDADAVARHIARETGAILPKGQHEVREAVQILHLAASLVMQPQGNLLSSPPGRLSMARRAPLGVVGVISPFNYPLILSIRAVAPALAAGNAVVVKPDAQTPVAGGFVIARAFEEAGLPAGLLHVLPGGGDAGEAICTDPNVAMVSFTGSPGVGRRVGELAGRHLKKVSLELGGSNALIVLDDLDDADLDLAAGNAAWGAYAHQGQICMASNRILVHSAVAEGLKDRLVAKANHLPVGDPAAEDVALGPLINERQRDRVHGIVQSSVEAGARLEAGGTYDRLFYRPTVLSGVRPGMRVFDEEVFGPVASLVTVSSDDEAVALANRTTGSLSAAIISPSVSRAMALGARLRCGMVHVNDQTVNDECVNPFGGPGSAGNGTNVGGLADADLYTQWQWVTVQGSPPQYPF
jgi:benzaldehyde dehydrogenase (NAD)